MNEALIQHHFDEVFMALQDVENFEIFSRIKKAATPRIRRTLFKIITSADDEEIVNVDSYNDGNASVSRTASQLKSVLDRSNNNTSTDTPSSSRPSSRSSTFRKIFTTSSKLNAKPYASLNLNTSSDSTQSAGGRKVYSSSLMKRDKNVEMRNTLFECKYCGRFILGDFLEVHEGNCGNESL